jgi:hypothetical protein
MSTLVQFSYLQLLDILTTLAFLSNGVSEGNPLVAFAIQMAHNPLIGLTVVKVAALALGIYCWRSGRPRVLFCANVGFAALIVWNLIALIVSGSHS